MADKEDKSGIPEKEKSEKVKEYVIVNIEPELGEDELANAREQAERKLYDVFCKYFRGGT